MLPQINQYLLLVEKLSFILGSVIYLIFGLVIVKQVSVVSKEVRDKFNSILIAFSYFHLIFCILLVILTLTL